MSSTSSGARKMSEDLGAPVDTLGPQQPLFVQALWGERGKVKRSLVVEFRDIISTLDSPGIELANQVRAP